LEKLKQSKGVTVAWRSFELRPKGSPPMPPEYRARIEATQPRFNQMVRESYSLEINRGPMGIPSRSALIGAKYAESTDKGDAYHAAIYRAYWLKAKSIDDRQVLVDVAQSIGLYANAFIAALDNPKYEALVDQDIEQAQLYGLNGVPALVFNHKYLVSGAQPYETLRAMVEKIEGTMES
jgi:predicted DsbA family dithiol-disulfide isomerase